MNGMAWKVALAWGLTSASPHPTTTSAFDGSKSSAKLVGAPLDTAADKDEVRFRAAHPLSAKSIGHTSVVFRMRLEGSLEIAFKPRTRSGHSRYRGEIAAYRLARALGLPNVPMAFPRRFLTSELRPIVGEGTRAQELLSKEVVADSDGTIRGAMLPWLPHYEVLPLETSSWRVRWLSWLSAGTPLREDEASLAEQISTMIAFDYLTANWDRWSGGNIAIDRSKGILLYVDNDGAFFEPPPAAALHRQWELLQKVSRFSQRFVEALESLDGPKLKEALGEESPGLPLLSEASVRGILERRKSVLELVAQKTKAPGASPDCWLDKLDKPDKLDRTSP